VEPIDGLDIVTTIDVGMQDAAEKILTRKLKEINAEVGVVVLLEVPTGDVKAIVNMTRIAPGVYAEVKNNAITDLWEPGSTFKTASMMVALEDGMVKRGDMVDVGNGQHLMHGRVMKDHNWRKGGYGRAISVDECLMFSSNVGVSRIIDEHYFKHPEKYVDGLLREGVGVPFNLPFPGAGKPYVRRPKPDGSNWSKTALAWMSIGYETQIPPIYTVSFYNAIANNGCMVEPRFVKAIERNGEVLKEFPVKVVKQRICSPSTLKDVHDILERVVNDPTGLGKKAGCKQFKVCGKTGTAQVADEHGSYHGSPARYMVSFAGFYPSENPQYSCVVCIKKSGLPASGGGQAGPVFSELAQYVMSKGVFRPADEAADSTSVLERPLPPTIPDTVEGQVPDTRGLGVRDAVALLQSQGMKVKVLGQGRVHSQSAAPGTKAVKDQVVTLDLRK
jgi:cell division protein FtsI (penicillin-binding protein 3)